MNVNYSTQQNKGTCHSDNKMKHERIIRWRDNPVNGRIECLMNYEKLQKPLAVNGDCRELRRDSFAE